MLENFESDVVYEVIYDDASILCACTCGGPRGPFDGSGSPCGGGTETK